MDFIESSLKTLSSSVQELKPRESATQSSKRCLHIFNAMGAADAQAYDINIAHRIPQRTMADGPTKPIIERIKQGRRQLQRERHKNNRFNEQTITVHAFHVRFTCWYISVPSSTKQQRKMIKTSGLWRTSVHDEKHFILSKNFNAVHIYQFLFWLTVMYFT